MTHVPKLIPVEVGTWALHLHKKAFSQRLGIQRSLIRSQQFIGVRGVAHR